MNPYDWETNYLIRKINYLYLRYKKETKPRQKGNLSKAIEKFRGFLMRCGERNCLLDITKFVNEKVIKIQWKLWNKYKKLHLKKKKKERNGKLWPNN